MAKISKFLEGFHNEMLEDNERNIDIDDLDEKRAKDVVHELMIALKTVPDQRVKGRTKFNIEDIIIMATFSVLGGCNTWREIELFCKSYKKFFSKFTKTLDETPSHDTFRRVFGLIDTEKFFEVLRNIFIDKLDELAQATQCDLQPDKYIHVAIDGKEMRGSGRKRDEPDAISNTQILNVYDNSREVCLYCEPINEKTNEIPTAQNIIDKLDLRQTIVTADALHTQRETVAKIVEHGGEYVLGLKSNQKDLYDNMSILFIPEKLDEIKNGKRNYWITNDHARSQDETREYFLIDQLGWYDRLNEWKNISSIVCCKRTIQKQDKSPKSELSYYICSLNDIELCAEAIRAHWAIENNLHWQLDYSFCEDRQSTTDKNALTNISSVNKFVLALLKVLKHTKNYEKLSITMIRKAFGFSFEEHFVNLFNCLSYADIINATSNN